MKKLLVMENNRVRSVSRIIPVGFSNQADVDFYTYGDLDEDEGYEPESGNEP